MDGMTLELAECLQAILAPLAAVDVALDAALVVAVAVSMAL